MNRGRSVLFFGVVAFTFLLQGCDSDPAEPEPYTLGGQTWYLEAFGPVEQEAQVISGTAISAEFKDNGRVTGNAGCNDYGGDYGLGSPNTVLISDIVATHLFCTAPVGIADQESDYFAALRMAEEYTINGTTLEVLYGDNQNRLVFRVAR